MIQCSPSHDPILAKAKQSTASRVCCCSEVTFHSSPSARSSKEIAFVVPPTAAQYGSSRNVNSLGVGGAAHQVRSLRRLCRRRRCQIQKQRFLRRKIPSSHVVGRLNGFEFGALDILLSSKKSQKNQIGNSQFLESR